MQALALCQKVCPTKIPFAPATKLGDGADGDVYEIVGDPHKVIKFCVMYDRYGSDLITEYEDINKVLCYLEKHKPAICARVYEHAFLTDGIQINQEYQLKYLLYYYVMEKLQKITEDEKKVFHSILSHEDRGIIKNFSEAEAFDMLMGMSKGLEFDFTKVFNFYDALKESSIKHRDIHVRNIMKDGSGNFRLIDFDRVELGE